MESRELKFFYGFSQILLICSATLASCELNVPPPSSTTAIVIPMGEPVSPSEKETLILISPEPSPTPTLHANKPSRSVRSVHNGK